VGENLWTLLGMLAAVAAILAMAYWTTRWIASRGGRGFSPVQDSRNFRVAGRINVGRSGQLLLVCLEERCLLLGVTEHSITVLKELEGEEAARWLEDAPVPPSFWEALQKNLGKRK